MVPGPRKKAEGKDRKPLTTREKARELLWGLFFFDYWREMVGAQKRYEDATNLFLFGNSSGFRSFNPSSPSASCPTSCRTSAPGS